MSRSSLAASALLILALPTAAAPAQPAVAPPDPAPIFDQKTHAVSRWRIEAAHHLLLTSDQVAVFLGPGDAPRTARCVKLNNYWCIKKAGWNGEIAADGEGHVAFASAVEGAAVAALLLKRYYVDFNRRTALAIISHWAPAECGLAGGADGHMPGRLAMKGLGNTLRARWLASHSRGFAAPVAGRKTRVRRSVVADHISRLMPAPTIVAGLGETGRPTRPMTLDALLMASPNAPPSRSMLGMPRHGLNVNAAPLGSVSACSDDGARIAAYAGQATAGITPGLGGDLALFAADGTPTANLAIMMTNMARVEIGPLGTTPELIQSGIAEAFKPGRNPDRS